MGNYCIVPLVLVEGFLAATSAIFWGNFEQFLNASNNSGESRRIILTSVGPVSSLHDRACELYYELKGGRVDYGLSHAKIYGHERYGREYRVGLYPLWSPEHPLHFLGHSLGGPTITKLIALLREGFFGEKAHPNMILSITSVSAPFRGTQIVYALGEKTGAAPAVRSLSVGSFITRAVHTFAYLAPLLSPLPFDLHADARRLAWNQSSFFAFLRQMWKSDWAEGCDAAPYDCTFRAADEREVRGEGMPNPGTWYRSHTVSQQSGSGDQARHAPIFSYLYSPFYLPSLVVSLFDFSTLRPSPSWFREHTKTRNCNILRDPLDIAERGEIMGMFLNWTGSKEDPPGILGEEYHANDGVVPVFSQWHPLPCSSSHCRHFGAPGEGEGQMKLQTPAPGIWHVHLQPGVTHHITLVPLWFGTRRQRKFWNDLGVWLELVERGKRERL